MQEETTGVLEWAIGGLGAAIAMVAGWLHIRINDVRRELGADHRTDSASMWRTISELQRGTAEFRVGIAQQLGALSNLPAQMAALNDKIDRLISTRHGGDD